MKKPEYLKFVDVESPGKTRRVVVQTTKSGVTLGTISWYGGWRQYVFRPMPDTIFNNGCLNDIGEMCGKYTREHRESLRRVIDG